MLTEISKQEQESWLSEFSVEDLSRSLIRQFCLQNSLAKTLKTFELEDNDKNHKKINKSVLIKILSMNNLVYFNKYENTKKYRSLLEILVHYLKNKFKHKIENIGKQVNNAHQQSDRDNNDQISKNDVSITPTILSAMGSNNIKNKDENQYDEQFDNQWENQEEAKKNKLVHSVDNGFVFNPIKTRIVDPSIQSLANTAELVSNNTKQQYVNKKKVQSPNIAKQQEQQLLNQNSNSKHKAIENKLNQQKKDDETISQIKLKQKRSEQIKTAQYTKNQPNEKNRKTQSTKIGKQEEQKIQSRKQQVSYIPTRPKSAIRTFGIKNQKKQVQVQAKQVSGSRMMGMKRKMKYQYTAQVTIQSKPQPIKSTKQKIQPDQQKQNTSSKNQQSSTASRLSTNDKKEQIIENNTQDQEGPKMVKMFGKKKKNLQEHAPSKFKFDDNFVDVPLNAPQQQYKYEKFDMFNIVIQEQYHKQYQNSIDYRIKFHAGMTSKKNSEKQKNITQPQATALRQVIFQKQGNQCVLPKSWYQGFILSPHHDTPYGLKQIEGGPCGIIAAVQCYYLKHFLYLTKIKSNEEGQNQLIRQNCLIIAITDMLFKSRNQNQKIILGLPPKGFAGNKIDYSGLKIYTLDASSIETAYQSMCSFKSYFIGKSNHGVTVLMICMILTKGIDKIKQQIDMPESPLIGNHGHCTQQLVNLFITGTASSNCFDGQKVLDTDMKLKGIYQKSQFGFLTIFETLKYIQVGKNLKNPIFPFWIICKQFHYHVVFANHYLISENCQSQKFDIVYFDGLYNCGDRIIITMDKYPYEEQQTKKDKDLPLIEQVMMTKWGKRKTNWNGSIQIL